MSVSSSPPFAPTASLKGAMVAFEGHMEREGFSENTVKAFMSDLNILREFVGAGRSVGRIGTKDLSDFLDWLQHGRDVPCNAKSLARRLTTLKVFFGWLTESGVLEADPAAPVAHTPVSTPLPQILKDDEIDQVLNATQALRHRPDGGKPDARPHLLVTLLLHTGMKKSECMSLVLNHVNLSDPDNPAVWIRYQDPRRRHKERKLDLPQEWPAVLEEYKQQYEVEDHIFPCTPRNLEYVLGDVAEAAGLDEGLSFEMLRWTSAVRDYRAQMPAERQRQKMGLSKASWREVKVKLARLAQKPL
jgi:site-specific recombinase XerD